MILYVVQDSAVIKQDLYFSYFDDGCCLLIYGKYSRTTQLLFQLKLHDVSLYFYSYKEMVWLTNNSSFDLGIGTACLHLRLAMNGSKLELAMHVKTFSWV